MQLGEKLTKFWACVSSLVVASMFQLSLPVLRNSVCGKAMNSLPCDSLSNKIWQTLHVQLGLGWDVFQNGWDGSQPLRRIWWISSWRLRRIRWLPLWLWQVMCSVTVPVNSTLQCHSISSLYVSIQIKDELQQHLKFKREKELHFTGTGVKLLKN